MRDVGSQGDDLPNTVSFRGGALVYPLRLPSSSSLCRSLAAMAATRRPLPSPPSNARGYAALNDGDDYLGMPAAYPYSAYVSPFSYPPPFSPQADADFSEPRNSTLRGGTLLHKGFYDLLSLIPSTPSPSRLFWRGGQNEEPIAGPRYEEIPPDALTPTKDSVQPLPQSPQASSSPPPVKNLKTRRISKDMVSKPTGFVYVTK